jgi:hypothetical protein
MPYPSKNDIQRCLPFWAMLPEFSVTVVTVYFGDFIGNIRSHHLWSSFRKRPDCYLVIYHVEDSPLISVVIKLLLQHHFLYSVLEDWCITALKMVLQLPIKFLTAIIPTIWQQSQHTTSPTLSSSHNVIHFIICRSFCRGDGKGNNKTSTRHLKWSEVTGDC